MYIVYLKECIAASDDDVAVEAGPQVDVAHADAGGDHVGRAHHGSTARNTQS